MPNQHELAVAAELFQGLSDALGHAPTMDDVLAEVARRAGRGEVVDKEALQAQASQAMRPGLTEALQVTQGALPLGDRESRRVRHQELSHLV